MTVEITAYRQKIGEVRIDVRTTDFREFSIKISDGGIEFHGDRECSDNAITKSVDDLFEWIRKERPKGRNTKLFEDRKALKPRPPKSAEMATPPKFLLGVKKQA